MPSLLIDIEARFAAFQDALDKVVGQTKKAGDSMSAAMSQFKNVMATLGVGLSIGAFAAFIKSAADSQDKLRELSITTGITVEKLGALRGIATSAGTDIETVAEAMAKLSRNMSTSGENTATVSGAFKFLGVNARDASGNLKSAGDVMIEIAKKLNEFQDGAGKTAIVMDLFGKGAAHLIPYLKELGEVTDFNSKVTKKAVEQAHEFELQMRAFEKQSLATKTALANSLIPTITELLEQLVKGKEIFGSFTAALGTLGTANPFQSPAEAIRGYNKQLEELQERRQKLVDQGRSGWLPNLDEEQKKLEKLKAFAQFMQQQQVRAGVKELGDIRDANDLRREFKEPLNYNRKDPRNISEDAGLGALAQAQAQKRLEAIKYANDTELKLLDTLHSEALVSEETYWADKHVIEQRGFTASMEVAQELLTERKRLLSKAEAEEAKPSIINNAKKGVVEAEGLVNKILLEQVRERVTNSIGLELGLRAIRETANESQVKAYEQITAATKLADDALQSFSDTQREAQQDQKFQLELIGQSVAAQGELNGLRRIQLDFQRESSRFEDQPEKLEDLRKRAEAAKFAFIELYDAILKKSRLASTGAIDALTEYIDHATNAAEQTKTVLVDAFKAAEDALVNFTKTGKLDFKSFANAVIDDLIRIQARQALAKVGSAALDWLKVVIGGGAPAPSGSGLGSSGVFEGRAGGGDVMAGTNYLVGERGPEIFQPSTSGTIIPNGGGVGTVNINFMGGPPTDQQTFLAAVIPIIKSVSRGEISNQLRDGGVLARA